MDLWQEILYAALQDEELRNELTTKEQISELIDSTCYMALKRIKEIIEDDQLSDTLCFAKIEEIVCVFESLGSNGGNRHDF